MPARSPHRRGHGDLLRAELVRAATDLLLAARPAPAPSLRAIARECGVAPSAVYLHFPSQEALLTAVVEETFAQLRAAFDAADDTAAPPIVRLEAMAGAYLGWAVAHPGAYQLLFERPDPAVHHAVGPGIDLLDRVTQALVALRAVDAPGRAQLLWCGLHGLASLHIHKPDAPWETSPGAAAGALVAALSRGPGQ